MIICPTKQTIERFRIPMANELVNEKLQLAAEHVIATESSDSLLCWGAKLFYLDGRKCLQLMNFASKLTVCLFDFKVAQLENLGDMLATYIVRIFTDGPLDKGYPTEKWLAEKKKHKTSFDAILTRFFKDYPMVAFSKLSDRSTISSMNNIELTLLYPEWLYKFIQNGILCSLDIARDINWSYPMTMRGEENYSIPAERFEVLLRVKYQEM